MSSTTWWIIVLSGLGTFALRWLPLQQALRQRQAAAPAASSGWQHWLQAILAGVGPAAVTALLVISLWDLLKPAALTWQPMAAVLAGLAVVALARRLASGVAVPTLAGALAYGLMVQWLVPPG